MSHNMSRNISHDGQPVYFASSTELADLGAARFDHDTAAVGDKDYALNSYSQAPITIQAGRAPKGLENQVFAWNTFQYTTTERDEKEERKGALHEGQLHRANRAAQGISPSVGRAGGAPGRDAVQLDALCAGRKPEGKAPPLAKGFAEELDKSMFWDGPIC